MSKELENAGAVQIFGDGEGIVVTGDMTDVEQFLASTGLTEHAKPETLGRLKTLFSAGSDAFDTVSTMVEQSCMYLKLTPESSKRLKEAGGLMSAGENGTSYAMLGKVGEKSLKWLKVETGNRATQLNPAILSGIGGLMAQFAQQTEAQELRAWMERIDDKLDDVRRAQRDSVLARLNAAAAAIKDAMTIRDNGGDPKTLWDKVSGVSESIFNVQEEALLALAALAEKVEGKKSAGGLKRALGETEHQVAVQLAILARCFELQDEFRVIELDHVFETAPQNLEGHRLGLAHAREQRRLVVGGVTRTLMARLDAAGAVADENVILHLRAARSAIGSLNATAQVVDEFHEPLGIEGARITISVTPWRAAFRNSDHRGVAGKEVLQKASAAGSAIAVIGGMAVAGKQGLNRKP